MEAEEQCGQYGRGLGIRALGHMLSGIETENIELASDAGDADDVYWPARSRRGTVDEGSRPGLRHRSSILSSDTRSQGGHASPASEFDSSTLPIEAETRSLWDLLRDDAGSEEWEGWAVDGKWERIQEFMAVPLAVERVSF